MPVEDSAIHRTSALLVEGDETSTILLSPVPFCVGRHPDCNLILRHDYVSRRHAHIADEHGCFSVTDLGSRHGTFVNGARVAHAVLSHGDIIQFGSPQGPELHFGGKRHAGDSTVRDLLAEMSGLKALSSADRTIVAGAPTGPGAELEKLNWLLEAARKLNSVDAVEEILASLLETTLALTRVERGYVFLAGSGGALRMAVGRGRAGQVLREDGTLSQSAIAQAMRTAAAFIVTDTLTAEGGRSESMVAQSIRSVICIPLRSRRSWHRPDEPGGRSEVLGLLYLDDRLTPGYLTQVDNQLLTTIAAEAAALIENAQLALAEEQARRYREELNIAASIQHRLMTVKIPSLPFASIDARNLPCLEVGGDFFDVIAGESAGEQTVSLVICDVSGKGVSAAILASTLQGMLYAQLLAGQPLAGIAHLVNRYICAKDLAKYATLVLLRLHSDGLLEYINCGHLPPLVCRGTVAEQLPETNLPVGLMEHADYASQSIQLEHAARVLLVTDGVTEAENAAGEFFGEERLVEAALCAGTLDELFTHVQQHCGGAASTDDCTMVDLRYLPPAPSW